MSVLIGADPEVFVMTKDGKFISGHHFPCGTKLSPRKTDNGAVQVDGIALEFNVNPSATREAFVHNLKSVVGDLNKIVAEHFPEAFLKAIPTAEVGAQFLAEVPFENRELGCNPDYNAYSMAENPVPNGEAPFRTGSGHVHVGFCEPNENYQDDIRHFMKCAKIARNLDYYLGLPSLDWDNDSRRRELYGQAGAFRPKPYGMEYRVLSNRWVEDDALAGFVFDQTQKAMTNLDNGVDLAEEYGFFAQETLATANTNWKSIRSDIYNRVM